MTWADDNLTLSTFEKPYSVCTHRRNALISGGEGEELKSTSSEERFPLEWVTTCARRVQFLAVFVVNFWAVLSRYKYLNVSRLIASVSGIFGWGAWRERNEVTDLKVKQYRNNRAECLHSKRQCWRRLECFWRVSLYVKSCREKRRGKFCHSKKCMR